MKAIDRAYERRAPPAVGGTVVGVCHELGVLAPIHCSWTDSQQRLASGLTMASITLGDPAGPAVLAERVRFSRVGALDVRMVEFARCERSSRLQAPTWVSVARR